MALQNGHSSSFEEIDKIANYLLEHTNHRPTIGIVCGTGLGTLVNTLRDQNVFPYDKIPNFPVSTVQGHAGNLVFGKLDGKTVVCMQGRFHYYEGYSLDKVTVPIRVMRLLGVKTMVVTNAAGGINSSYNVGDIMVLKDHLNMLSLTGINPLRGPNDEKFGVRFPPLTTAYSKELRQLAKSTAKDLGFSSFTREGVYACVGGPSYETPAELRFLQKVGADAVGMSTAHEVITAVHCGMSCLGISLITNAALPSEDVENNIANHEEVLAVGNKRSADVEQLVSNIVGKLPE